MLVAQRPILFVRKTKMRKRELVLAAACATVLLNGTVMATITVDGSYDTDYGAPLALQTNNTGFGDSTSADGHSTGGSELDAAYGVVQNGNLNILFTGNFENNGNNLDVFIADGRPGQNTIKAASGSAIVNKMNTSKFSPGFAATYGLAINDFHDTVFVNQFDMTQATAPSNFFGSFAPNTNTSTTLQGVAFSLNNTNAAGVNGTTATAADPTAAAAVQTGMEISIPLSQLGSPSGGSIAILADINGGGNSFLSNQFLTGLGSITGNLGNGGKFDFSGTANQFFTVSVPASGGTNGLWALTTGGSWGSSSSWTGGVPQVAADTATFGPAITGASTVTLDGPKTVGKVTFNNANTYTIDAGTGGTLTIDDTTDSLGNNPAINVQLGNHVILAPVALASGVTVNTLDSTSLTVKGQISGSGDITHTGAGNLALAGSNSFSGNITSTAGTVELDNANAASGAIITLGDRNVDNLAAALNIGSSVTSLSNAIVTNRDLADGNNLRTVSTSGNTAINGTVSINGGVVFAPASGTTVTVNGLVQNGTDTSGQARFAIHSSGAGTVVLNNAETNTGDTFIDSGTLVLASGASLQSGSVNVLTGGAFVDNGLLLSTVKLYTRGILNIPGNTTAFPIPLSTGTIDIDDAGSMTIGHSASTAAPVQVTAGSLEFLNNGTGKLDLTNNQLDTTNPQSTVIQQLAAGNIITSTPGGTLGYKDDGAGGTQIQFAVTGDADLTGVVDSNDFAALAANYGQTGVFWSQGDFNYDGTVNALDFNALANNFGKSVPASAPVAALGSVVPEPTMLSLAGFAMAGLLRRRSPRRK